MLYIKLILDAIAVLVGIVYVIGMVAEVIKHPKGATAVVYLIAVFWMAFGEVFFIRYGVDLIRGIR